MNTIITILSVLVALEFFYIMYLETFATTSSNTGRVFNMTSDELQNKHVQTLFKNQGIYNGLIAVAVLYTLLFTPNHHNNLLAIMVYIILVGLYGSFSSGDKLIVLKQAGLAIIVAILLLIA